MPQLTGQTPCSMVAFEAHSYCVSPCNGQCTARKRWQKASTLADAMPSAWTRLSVMHHNLRGPCPCAALTCQNNFARPDIAQASKMDHSHSDRALSWSSATH